MWAESFNSGSGRLKCLGLSRKKSQERAVLNCGFLPAQDINSSVCLCPITKDCIGRHRRNTSLWVDCPAWSKDQHRQVTKGCVFPFVCSRTCLSVCLSKHGVREHINNSSIDSECPPPPPLPNASPLLPPTIYFCTFSIADLNTCHLWAIPSFPFPFTLFFC